MKKNPVKMLAAFALSLTLAAGGTAVAGASAQHGTLTGVNDVATMIVSVIVPANLDFTLDPFELTAAGGSQIAPADYFFINKTNIPVKVTMDLTANLVAGASLVDDRSELGKDDDTATDKKLFFAILGADTLIPGDMSYDKTTGHTATGGYDAGKDTLIPFDASSRSASIAFALGPTDGPGDLAESGKSVGLFRFYGELNTYASWAEGDVKVSGTYNITPLRSSTYDGYSGSGAFTDGGWGTQLKLGGRTDGNPDGMGGGSGYDYSGNTATEPKNDGATEQQPNGSAGGSDGEPSPAPPPGGVN